MIAAQAHHFNQIMLNERTYRVPTFQRPYRWWRNDYDAAHTLFDDIADLALRYQRDPRGERSEHFLGSIVLRKRLNPRGYDEWLVLDGQQRLLTMLMLLRAMKAVAEETGARLAHDPDDLLWTKPFGAQQPRPRFLASVADGEDYRRALRCGPVAQGGERAGNIRGAASALAERIRRLCREEGDAQAALDALDHVARFKLRFIVVEIESDVAPNRVFKRLNSAGEELSSLDLIKNDLFEKVVATRDVEDPVEATADDDLLRDLYERLWKPLDREDALKFWARPTTVSNLSSPHSDWMLRAYLRAVRGEASQKVREVMKNAQDLIDEREREPEALLTEISRAAEVYRRLELAHPSYAADDAGALAFTPQDGVIRLFARSDSQAALIALEALAPRDGAEPAWAERAQAAKDLIEGFGVRRFFTTYGQRRSSEPDFPLGALLKALKRAREAGADPAAAVAEALASKTPDDDAFAESWRRLPIFLLRPENMPRGAAARVILRRLFGAIDPEGLAAQAEAGGEEPVTVEHLWPQRSRRNWPEPEDGDLIHSVGNLTLCTKPLNADLSQESWFDKAAILRGRGELSDHADLAATPVWDAEAIAARADRLLKTALVLWPAPA